MRMAEMNQYNELIQKIKENVSNLGAANQPLTEYVEELERRTADINSLEGQLEAIRNEIIEPVNRRLARTHRAQTRSLYLGILAFVLSVGSLLFAVYRPDPNEPIYTRIDSTLTELGDTVVEQQSETRSFLQDYSKATGENDGTLARMMQRMLDRTGDAPFATQELTQKKGELRLSQSNRVSLFSPGQHDVQLRLIGVQRVQPLDTEDTMVMIGLFEVFLDGDLVGGNFLDNIINVDSEWPRKSMRINDEKKNNRILIAEEDKFTILDIHRFTLSRVHSIEPLGRPTGDKNTEAYVLPLQ